ncbi:ATP synthase subunit s-like protein [Collichthys lucidus]|uniref:Distal membrane-arm assembly complex protein 2 n=1 Tax=Collichthys lucidus TaxID=240159 RepID=A0A4U5V135_COLLU|nr:ATP synthase subunit s-like protein [Collichthys lucidus]
MLPAVGSAHRHQATVELRLGVPPSSAHQASPLPHTAFLRRRDAPELDVSVEEEGYYGYTQRFYGSDLAAAYYVLSMKGAFRFVGQTEWYCPDKKGKFNWDFLNHRDTQLEEVNMNYTLINYTGLVNLEEQRSLRTLSVRGCSEVDDWFLARLHVLQDSLEELDISHCPRITTGGLAALRNLKGLRRLDVSSLPGISSPGLVIILLEEMLPQCQITATGYDLSLS